MPFDVLIVDDAALTRDVVRRALQLARTPIGEVREAGNGREALEMLQANRFDVVISDVQMPVMTGAEMIRSMSADERLRSIPVIILSTDGSVTRLDALQNLGAKGYVRKPFTPAKLRDALQAVTGERWHETGQRSA